MRIFCDLFYWAKNTFFFSENSIHALQRMYGIPARIFRGWSGQDVRLSSLSLSSEVENERFCNSLTCTGVELHFVSTCLCSVEGKRSVLMNFKLLEGRGHRLIWKIYRHFPGGAEDSHKKLRTWSFSFENRKSYLWNTVWAVSTTVYFAVCVRLNLSWVQRASLNNGQFQTPYSIRRLHILWSVLCVLT